MSLGRLHSAWPLPPMPVRGVQRLADAQDPATLVVRNAKVYTGDPTQPSASAEAMRGGVFAAVGDHATVAPFVGPSTRVIDALGQRVIPGLNDSHAYLLELVASDTGIDRNVAVEALWTAWVRTTWIDPPEQPPPSVPG